MKSEKRRAIAPANMLLRCYAEREDNQWVVVCIDLNLAAQADTFAEAKRKLHHQIEWYVYDAMRGPDKDHVADLMSRRAPLPLLMRYHFAAALSHIRAMREQFRSFCDFLPLSPQRPAAA
jgi:predicted RNase H-like HicB family nuclease